MSADGSVDNSQRSKLEDRMVSLGPNEGFTVPRGVMHFPHAGGRTVVMMVEKAGLVPTGN